MLLEHPFSLSMLYECQECYDNHGFPCGWAVWQMVESEEQLCSLCSSDCSPCKYTHEARRREYYAVRALLAAVLGKEKTIAYLPSGHPYLTDHSYNISISHTKGFCALAWHAGHPVGVDIEMLSPRVSRVAHRFVSPAEQILVENHFPQDVTRGQLLLWSAKEAAYKLVDRPATDFLRDIIVDGNTLDPDTQTCRIRCRVDVPDGSTTQVSYPMHYRFFQNFVFVLVGVEQERMKENESHL